MGTLQPLRWKSTIGLCFMLVAMILGLPPSQSAPLEEAKFLRQIADQYSAPLVVSFLHSRIQKNEEMISKIKTSVKDLDQSKLDVFDLAEKTLKLLEEQLTSLEKADYFDFNGTEKVKHFIEQFIMQNEMYPVEFGSYGEVKVAVTPDALLEDLYLKSSDVLISSTNSMIQTYLSDIDEKERSFDSNRLQKLSAFMARRELQLLADNQYPPNRGYSYDDANDPRKVALGTVLRKVKTVVDFFYAQFSHLADPKSSEKPSSEVSDNILHEIEVVTIEPTERHEEPSYPWFNRLPATTESWWNYEHALKMKENPSLPPSLETEIVTSRY